MMKTIGGIVGITAAVLWLPAWVQLGLFVLAIIALPHRLAFLVPAIVADVVYAPTYTLSLHNLKMTCIVLGMLIIWYVIMNQTRLGEPATSYVSIKK